MNPNHQSGEAPSKSTSQSRGGWSGGPRQHDNPADRNFALVVVIVVLAAVGAAVFATLKYL